MPVKKNKKMDGKLIAAKQNDESEVKYVARKYRIPIKIVRATMLEIKGNGKAARSRDAIYEALKLKGYDTPVKDKKPKKVNVELLHDKKGNLIV
ncbi:MAG: hypothetical protein V4560_14890 [Bacteroidota bacterium]